MAKTDSETVRDFNAKSKKIGKILNRSTDVEVIRLAADHPNAPPAALHRLALSSKADDIAREKAIHNKNISEGSLEDVIDTGHQYFSVIAERVLKSRGVI